MKKIIARLLSMLVVVLVLCLAEEGTVTAQARKKILETKEYQYIVKNEKVVVKKYIGSKKKVIIPSKIAGKKVTAIASYAFTDSNVEVVTVPNGVTTLHTGAFEHCESLRKVILPERMDVIGSSAFQYCKNLQKVSMPKSIKRIGSDVFSECGKLKEIIMPMGIDEIPYGTFYNCMSLQGVTLPDSIRKIGRYAFFGCENLTTVGTLTLDEVERCAFKNCKKLSSKIVLSDKCVKVGDYAFCGCEQVNLTVPETITDIGEYSFAYCNQLDTIVIPDNFFRIGAPYYRAWDFLNVNKDSYYAKIKCNFDMRAYAGCVNIRKVIVNETNPYLVEENGVVYNKEKTDVLYVVPTYSGNMDFLKNVERIGYFAFTGSQIKEIVIPDNITEIYEGVFYNAQTSMIEWGKNVKEIPDLAFRGCNITELVIPEGVVSLGMQAISWCHELKSISLPASLDEYSIESEWCSIFRSLPALEEIIVAKESDNFYTKNGILFKRENSADILICYPASRKGVSYTVPKNVKLSTYCFDSLKYLKKVVLQHGGIEKSIFNYFVDCNGVTLVIPKTVIHFPAVGHSSDFPLFDNCKNCKALVYKDSKAYKYFKRVNEPQTFGYEVR